MEIPFSRFEYLKTTQIIYNHEKNFIIASPFSNESGENKFSSQPVENQNGLYSFMIYKTNACNEEEVKLVKI